MIENEFIANSLPIHCQFIANSLPKYLRQLFNQPNPMQSYYSDQAVEGSAAVDSLAKGQPLWVWVLGGGAIVIGKF